MQNSDFIADRGLFGGPVPAPPPGHTWETLMERAINAARHGMAEGEVPVGAVIVHKAGAIISTSANRVERERDPTAHAEMLAIRLASQACQNARLSDCVLVATLEPCAMCLGAIAHARLNGVVYGAADLRAGCIHSACDWQDMPLADRKFWHMGGILAQPCGRLLREFFEKRR